KRARRRAEHAAHRRGQSGRPNGDPAVAETTRRCERGRDRRHDGAALGRPCRRPRYGLTAAQEWCEGERRESLRRYAAAARGDEWERSGGATAARRWGVPEHRESRG